MMALRLSKKLKRIVFLVFGVLAAFILVVLIFLSAITKYLIEKYSEAYTGRKITMSDLHINAFNGIVRFDDLKIYEANRKTIFFECRELYLNITVYKLWAGEYDITELTMDRPTINIIQRGNRFNYDDLVKRFSEKGSDVSGKKKPARYWIHNLQID